MDPPVMRFGVGVSDHREGGVMMDGYWDAVEHHRKEWLGLGLPFDPFEECRAALGAEWPGGVSVGRRGGREMGSGVAREPNQGFQVHFDDALREFSGDLLDATLVAQFAFNAYISVSESGGETIVWRHLWGPADEAFRLPGSYGYAEAVVGEAESIELSPEIGEAVLINPRYFHAVRPSQGSRRIALGFAVGLSTTGELLAWG
ncbi:proline hydroxylase [Streptomyces sp. NPDC026206]|uniref:2OG-Fe(II)-dependent halogenase WelO5 family protein n=1 Tax=Streptomyces sp. NPDC026206 TaxID=3157089 RepID=UPI0033E41886